MPRPRTLVMTRPLDQARRFVADLQERLGAPIPTVYAPVMKITPIPMQADSSRFTGIILTSPNGAAFAPDLQDRTVFCVGNRTADAARARGAKVVLVAENAEALVAMLIAERPVPPLLHLRGVHARGRVAERLQSAGIETESMKVYDQIALPLSSETVALLQGDETVILPLFSPRSAVLAGQAVEQPGPHVHVISMSDAVARAWRSETGHKAEVCTTPTGKDMVRLVIRALTGKPA